MNKFSWRCAVLAFAVAPLVACGSDSTDVVVNDDQQQPGPTAGQQITGTAAIGAPMPNAPVQVRCMDGETSSQTDANGRFSVNVSGLSGPCFLRAPLAADSTLGVPDLVSLVIPADAGSVVSNLTPLTHLVTARLFADNPSSSFSTNADLSSLTNTLLGNAQAQIEEDLRIRLGVLMPAACSDWISSQFDAVRGDPLDDSLEILVERLGQISKSFDQLVVEVAGIGPALVGQSVDPIQCGNAI